MRHLFLTGLAVTAMAFSASIGAYAGEIEDRIVDSVIAAYGGDKIEALKSLTIKQDLRSSWIGQGYTPDYVQLPQVKAILHVDMENERGNVEVWRASSGGHTRSFTSDEGMVTINYGAGVYQVNPDGTFYQRFGGSIRTSDTLLAYELKKRADSAEHQGAEPYLGMPHDVLTFEMPQSPPLKLHVNSDTGLITKMTRDSDGSRLVYHFGDHAQIRGISYARDFDLFVDGEMVEYAKVREIEVNNVKAKTFDLEKGLRQDGARLDTSEMTVEGVGDIIHHVGKTGGYSSFIDAGDYMIGVGGYAGLKDRWMAYKADHEGADKPLRYMVVSHHHEDHMRGLTEANDLGVTFITPAMAVDDLKDLAGPGLGDNRIRVIETHMKQGPVEIHDIATSHVGSYALVYVPESKTVIQVDHYNGEFADGPSPANLGSLSLKNEIDRLGLDVDTILSLHGRKAESWDDFSAAVAKVDPAPCATDRPLCQ